MSVFLDNCAFMIQNTRIILLQRAFFIKFNDNKSSLHEEFHTEVGVKYDNLP